VIHPGAVMVIAQLDDGRLVQGRRTRLPRQRVMIEVSGRQV
jgi:ADP-ribose pyrophosphatase